MLKQMIALLLSATVLTTGCASATSGTMQAPIAINPATMADYMQRIPAGSRVRVERTNGDSLRGTLMRATADAITVQRNTRIPEAPIDIPLESIARVTLDNNGGTSTAKAIGIGVASGVGAFFAILAILAATWDD